MWKFDNISFEIIDGTVGADESCTFCAIFYC